MLKKINKYINTILMVLLLVMSSTTTFVNADETVYTEGGLYYTIEDDSITIIGCFDRDSVVDVPSSIANIPVNSIASGAFKDDEYVSTVNLPDTITYIADDAFSPYIEVNRDGTVYQQKQDKPQSEDTSSDSENTTPEEESNNKDSIEEDTTNSGSTSSDTTNKSSSTGTVTNTNTDNSANVKNETGFNIVTNKTENGTKISLSEAATDFFISNMSKSSTKEGTDDVVSKQNISETETLITKTDGTTVREINVEGDPDIKVTADSDLIPTGAVLQQTELSKDSDDYKVVEEAINNNSALKLDEAKEIFAYNFDLTQSNGTEIHELDGYVEVSLPVPSNITVGTNQHITAYRVNDDGSLTKCETEVVDGIITFKTDHFSTYIFALEEDEVATTITESETEMVEQSATSSNKAVYIAIGAAAVIAVFMVVKFKK